MIEKITIEEIVKNQTVVEDLFIVDINVSQGNSISVIIDSPKGVNINDCKQISRLIENSFDREIEDFGLQVSSPGLDQPLKVREQYLKNIGREVKIIKISGQKLSGKLINVSEDNIDIEYSEKVKIEGRKKKQIKINQLKVNFKEIKSTKIVISFR